MSNKLILTKLSDLKNIITKLESISNHDTQVSVEFKDGSGIVNSKNEFPRLEFFVSQQSETKNESSSIKTSSLLTMKIILKDGDL